jgi:hypothetical protein
VCLSGSRSGLVELRRGVVRGSGDCAIRARRYGAEYGQELLRRNLSCNFTGGWRRWSLCASCAGLPIPISCWKSRRSRRCNGRTRGSARPTGQFGPAQFHIMASQPPCVGRKLRPQQAGYIARGIGDVSRGRYAGHQSRLVAPPLSTGAALHARPGAEVVRASRPISPSE